MRLILRLTKNTQIIPYNHQELLTGCIHKWLGKDNSEHGTVSLYSFSWLQNVLSAKEGLWLKQDSYFTVSFFEEEQFKRVVKSILVAPELFCGSRVFDIQIRETPIFSDNERFVFSSPVLIKRLNGANETHYTYENEESNQFLMETLKTKLQIAGLDFGDFNIYFDKNYSHPKTKLVTYKGIGNRVNICPVIIEGSPELIGFAWNVGLGNSTGIGFGAIK